MEGVKYGNRLGGMSLNALTPLPRAKFLLTYTILPPELELNLGLHPC